MVKSFNEKKKKKGFTLIELVIVLAVLAIIALIAIPNFTKVRNDSLQKSDVQTAEQIKKITLMAIADGDILVKKSSTSIGQDGAITGGVLEYGVDPSAVQSKKDYGDMLKEVSKPQVNNKGTFLVKIDADGDVSVGYTKTGTINEFDNVGTLTK